MTKAETVFESIKNNHLDKLSNYLTEDPALAGITNDNNVSLLLYAIYHRNAGAIALIKSFKKTISIHEAACLGDLPVVKAALEKDLSLLNSFSPDGFTVLGYACFFGQEKIAEYLINTGANVNTASANSFRVAPIHSSCAISNFYLTRLLIENGADVNAKQQGGFTPLHSAVMNSAASIESLLLERGADKLAKNDEGKIPSDCKRSI
jgi:ankyrin repeat protein